MEITLKDEDDTIGFLLQQELLNDPNITYAGYSVPSFFERIAIIKFTVKEDVSARDIFIKNLNNIKSKLHKLQTEVVLSYIEPEPEPVGINDPTLK